MNKEQFVEYMNKKLAVIKEEERKDIIDEYCNHIDEKVGEGMSEEEVIEGFGDIDEMIKEILDAYNIDPRQAERPNNIDRKVNDFLDALFDGLQQLLSRVTSMDMDSIVKLIFEILVVLIILGLMRIPFEIVESIGSGLLRSLFGYGIGSTFAWIWRCLCSLLYIVMFLVALINVTSRRWAHFKGRQDTPIMDDVKESFNFDKAKEAVHRFTSGTANSSYESPYDEAQDVTRDESRSYHQSNQMFTDSAKSTQSSSILTVFLKCCGFLCMLPFIMLMIALCCGLGFLVVMSIQGVTIVGFYFLVIGAIVGCSAVISLIDSYLCKGGR